jgi:hypothetical protein
VNNRKREREREREKRIWLKIKRIIAFRNEMTAGNYLILKKKRKANS